jgi:hypothetical protein
MKIGNSARGCDIFEYGICIEGLEQVREGPNYARTKGLIKPGREGQSELGYLQTKNLTRHVHVAGRSLFCTNVFDPHTPARLLLAWWQQLSLAKGAAGSIMFCMEKAVTRDPEILGGEPVFVGPRAFEPLRLFT